jgi:(2Fe-2S) ferredoxin
MKNRNTIFGAILGAAACLAFVVQAQAAPEKPVVAPQIYPAAPEKAPSIPLMPLAGGNTADGHNALAHRTTGSFNSGLGWFSLFTLTTASLDTGVGAGTLALDNGGENTAVGAAALLLNTTGLDNNAVGAFALLNNTTGDFNNAHGRGALEANTTGTENEAFGDLALTVSVTGDGNTAVGDDALDLANGASFNTAVGKEACNTCTTGGDNVAIGHNALNGTVTASHNIAIGGPAVGPFADSSFTCFIYSIDGEPTSDIPSTVPVLIDSNNVLGTSASSRRYKHDIKPMDKASEGLFALKPISFIYNSDRTGTTLFGLIAEDVAQVNPNLVAYRDGTPYTVKYDQVNAMLLNEFLKEHKKVEEQQASISQLKSEMQTMVAQLKEQAAQIQKVSAQLEVNKPAPQVVANKP